MSHRQRSTAERDLFFLHADGQRQGAQGYDGSEVVSSGSRIDTSVGLVQIGHSPLAFAVGMLQDFFEKDPRSGVSSGSPMEGLLRARDTVQSISIGGAITNTAGMEGAKFVESLLATTSASTGRSLIVERRKDHDRTTAAAHSQAQVAPLLADVAWAPKVAAPKEAAKADLAKRKAAEDAKKQKAAEEAAKKKASEEAKRKKEPAKREAKKKETAAPSKEIKNNRHNTVAVQPPLQAQPAPLLADAWVRKAEADADLIHSDDPIDQRMTSDMDDLTSRLAALNQSSSDLSSSSEQSPVARIERKGKKEAKFCARCGKGTVKKDRGACKHCGSDEFESN